MCSSRFVVALNSVDRRDVDRAGGKGANLGDLAQAGFRVPPGFIVSTAAYQHALDAQGLADRIRTALDSDVQQIVLEAGLPDEVAQAVREEYRTLGGAVAVRSSATAEDLPDAAFAGQQDTLLNVVGEEAVIDAVLRCWASLSTERAVAYRQHSGIDHRDTRMAVVVQRMVAAESAGVLFTTDPVTGNRRHLTIDASPGLGEAVVSGMVTPEHLVVDKRWRRVISRAPGRQEVILGLAPDGGTERVARQAIEDLPKSATRKLVRTGLAVERHFGRPQDIEWAWAEDTVHVLQARPITALPESAPRPRRFERVAGSMVPEMLPERPYPLDVTAWTGTLLSAIRDLLGIAGIALPTLDRTFVEEDGVVVGFNLPHPRPTLRTLTAPARLARIAWRFNSARWQDDPLLQSVYERARGLRERDVRALDWQGLLTTIDEAQDILKLAIGVRKRYVPRSILAVAALAVVLRLLRRSSMFGALLSGVETKTTETNRALEELASRIRAVPRLQEVFHSHEPRDIRPELAKEAAGRAFLSEFDAFLDDYGHRDAVTPLLLSQPTWQEVPEVVLGLLKGFAAAAPPEGGDSPHVAARERLISHPLLRVRALRSGVLALLAQARWFQQMREDTRFMAALPLPAVRSTVLEMGRRLVEADVLDVAEDVFHLRLDELQGVGAGAPASRDLRERLERRKAKRASLAGKPLVRPMEPESVNDDALVRGAPGSSSVADGPVRVIRGIEEFGSLRTGDVLVAPYTNPAWTPLFQRAAAVVVDSGGVASHAAIVAREYGIPAVMGTHNGTAQLVNGTHVRVDGGRGLVLPLN